MSLKILLSKVFAFFASLRLTIVLLVLGMVLVFVGTLDQVTYGIYHAQKLYFESWVVVRPLPEGLPMATWLEAIPLPLPGGFLLGTLLLANLACAHFRYFKPTWRKLGISLIHGGIVLLILSGFVAAAVQEESLMEIDEGSAKNYSESIREFELAVIRRDPETGKQRVTAIPTSELTESEPFQHESLPFAIRPLFQTMNGFVQTREALSRQMTAVNKVPGGPNAPWSGLPEARVSALRDLAIDPQNVAFDKRLRPVLTRGDLSNPQGVLANLNPAVMQAEPVYREGFINNETMIVDIVGQDGQSISQHLLFGLATASEDLPPETVTVDGVRYELHLRRERTYFPFTLALQDFRFDRHPGTDIPANFSSDVILQDPALGEERPIRIAMNEPLRHGGATFFQASFDEATETTTVFQVVKNPGWTLPYIAVGLVGVGLTVQFSMHLFKHVRRRFA